MNRGPHFIYDDEDKTCSKCKHYFINKQGYDKHLNSKRGRCTIKAKLLDEEEKYACKVEACDKVYKA
jgi:hypothetical protein